MEEAYANHTACLLPQPVYYGTAARLLQPCEHLLQLWSWEPGNLSGSTTTDQDDAGAVLFITALFQTQETVLWLVNRCNGGTF